MIFFIIRDGYDTDREFVDAEETDGVVVLAFKSTFIAVDDNNYGFFERWGDSLSLLLSG